MKKENIIAILIIVGAAIISGLLGQQYKNGIDKEPHQIKPQTTHKAVSVVKQIPMPTIIFDTSSVVRHYIKPKPRMWQYEFIVTSSTGCVTNGAGNVQTEYGAELGYDGIKYLLKKWMYPHKIKSLDVTLLREVFDKKLMINKNDNYAIAIDSCKGGTIK